MKTKFKIAIPSFNSVDYIGRCLESLQKQIYRNYDVCIVDDASSILQQREIILDYCQRNHWNYLFQKINSGGLHSTIAGIHALNCHDEDVIVMLDADDWLYDEHALEIVNDAYEHHDIYLTYGQFETYPKGCINITYAASMTKEQIDKQLYRQMPWIYMHLKTFKYHVWKRIKDEDLRDEDGEYFRVTWDRAIFYPLLEMSAHKSHYIDKLTYVYNIANPLNDFKVSREDQIRAEILIKSRPKYAVIDG